MTKKNRKRKFNFLKFFLVLIIIYMVCFSIYRLAELPIHHIRVLDTVILKDQDILKQAKIDNYPSFLLTTSYSIKKRLKENPYIKEIKVEKKWFCQIYLHITEYKPLFLNNTSGQVVLENNKTIKLDTNINVPHLINYVPGTLYNKLVKKMTEVDNNILLKISEIEYRPNEVDKERFLLTMNDGNYVYLTLYTFSKINQYDKIYPTLENKRGILYLDSGNYFEIIN